MLVFFFSFSHSIPFPSSPLRSSSLRRGWSRSHLLGTEWPEWRRLSLPAFSPWNQTPFPLSSFSALFYWYIFTFPKNWDITHDKMKLLSLIELQLVPFPTRSLPHMQLVQWSLAFFSDTLSTHLESVLPMTGYVVNSAITHDMQCLVRLLKYSLLTNGSHIMTYYDFVYNIKQSGFGYV